MQLCFNQLKPLYFNGRHALDGSGSNVLEKEQEKIITDEFFASTCVAIVCHWPKNPYCHVKILSPRRFTCGLTPSYGTCRSIAE